MFLVVLVALAGFQERVRLEAASHDLWIEAWWSAELDGDPEPERVAILCAKAAPAGWFLIEDGARRHWLRFDVDGRTPWCSFEKPEPRFRRSRERTLQHHQGDHSTVERVRIALRGGEPAIVWREHLYRPHCTEEKTDVVDDFEEDWDALRATHLTRRYHGMRLGRGQVIARSVEPIVVCGAACPDAPESDPDRSTFLGVSVADRVYLKARYPRPDEAALARLINQPPWPASSPSPTP